MVRRQGLYRRMVGEPVADDLIARAWDWYMDFLDSHIQQVWADMVSPVIRYLPSAVAEATASDLSRVYWTLEIIADSIRTQKEVTLDAVTSKLKHADLIPPNSSALTTQMVFTLIGWMTMLYDPRTYPLGKNLQLRCLDLALQKGRRSRGTVCIRLSQDISEAAEEFHRMLGQFGNLIPEPCTSSSRDRNQSLAGDDSSLAVPYICLHSLKKVAKIRIEWVNTLSLHMQLDPRKRILCLYRFPSFCRLLLRNDSSPADPWAQDGEDIPISFLSQLYADHRKSLVRGSSVPHENDHLTLPDYLREVLLSYRLIFGIDGRSRDVFAAEEVENWSIDTAHDGPSFPSSFRRSVYKMDPLLTLLCTASPAHSSDLRALLALLDGEETSLYYRFDDFPFLGRRLADLQRFSMGQKPYDWKGVLFHDRRDVRNWWIIWTAWAVLLVGGGTIVLQAFQLGFQIWGTVQ